MPLYRHSRPNVFHGAEINKEHPTIRDIVYFNVIAQEFREVFPDYVTSSGDVLGDDGDPVLQVDVHPALVYSIKAIQELNDLVEAQRATIATQAAELDDLKSRLTALEALVHLLTQENPVR